MSTVRTYQPALTAGIAEPLHRALTSMFASARRPAPSAYMRNLVERIQAGRVALAEHLATVVLTAVQRGVPQEQAERLGHAYLAIVRREYARARGEVQPSREGIIARIVRLARAETVAQGRADAEVLDVLARPIGPEIAEAIAESSAHARASSELIGALSDLAVHDTGATTPYRSR